MQFVFAFENASVAAVNNETSAENNGLDDFAGWTGLSFPDVSEGISLGSSVEVMGAGSPWSGVGDDGGIGGALGLLEDVIGDGSVPVACDSSDALRKFCSPLMLGTKKL